MMCTVEQCCTSNSMVPRTSGQSLYFMVEMSGSPYSLIQTHKTDRSMQRPDWSSQNARTMNENIAIAQNCVDEQNNILIPQIFVLFLSASAHLADLIARHPLIQFSHTAMQSTVHQTYQHCSQNGLPRALAIQSTSQLEQQVLILKSTTKKKTRPQLTHLNDFASSNGLNSYVHISNYM